MIPRCLTWSVMVSSLRNKSIGFIPVRIRLLIKRAISVLSGLTERPWSGHHFSILLRATCITSHTVLRSIPATRAEKSSANPCAKYPTEFSAYNRPSAISIHMSADRTPPWRNPLVKWTSIFISSELVLAILEDSIESIHHMTLLARSMCNKEPGDALLNATSISRNSLRAYSLLFSAFSILLTRMCKAESVDLLAWYACWLLCRGYLVRLSSLMCLSTSRSTVFRKNDIRLTRRKDLTKV